MIFGNISLFLSYFNLLRGRSYFLLVTRGIAYSLYMYELHVYCDFNYDIMFCAILKPCYLQYFGVGISANRVDSLSSSISAILIILSKKDSGLEYTKKLRRNLTAMGLIRIQFYRTLPSNSGIHVHVHCAMANGRIVTSNCLIHFLSVWHLSILDKPSMFLTNLNAITLFV